MQPLAILSDWCRWLSVNEQRSMLIMGIPEDCEDLEFQETLHAALKPLGRYRVLGKVYRKEISAKIALVEFAECLNRALIPQQIQGKGGPWSVIVPSQTPDLESQEGGSLPGAQGHSLAGETGEEGADGRAETAAQFPSEAAASGEQEAAAEAGASEAGEVFGAGEVAPRDLVEEGHGGEEGAGGDEVSYEEGAAGDSGAAGEAGSPDVAAVAGEVVTAEEAGTAGEAGVTGRAGAGQEEAWTQQWRQVLQPMLESSAYQELRTFSGLQEADGYNEAFESWLHHANDMMFLWRDVPEKERRRRLLESLGGPALDVVFDLLGRNPHIDVQDCLVALVQVFGSQDPQVTARLKFVTCAQRSQETLFAYVMRLEGLLQIALEKGAINPAVVNQMRARQVLMQARPNDMLRKKLTRLRLERKPPGFMDILQLIRETEAWKAEPNLLPLPPCGRILGHVPCWGGVAPSPKKPALGTGAVAAFLMFLLLLLMETPSSAPQQPSSL
ncbi:paraneoplastic antigen Ma6F-like [Sorex araneus]|uniref:paraneoplastic antigen Ma6F-like n=1 Tax=Sorex araneus TaxID=42254 RepID=UPI00243344EA|nr:paraneoplastic antigen Ma6F-like [Sorex araneus]